jgi:hypothetical protein
MHGGKSPGAPMGNSHALKHGRFTAEAVAERREFAALLREMKGLVERWTATNERGGPFRYQVRPVNVKPTYEATPLEVSNSAQFSPWNGRSIALGHR